jgi:hypothetical protein
VNHRAGSRWLFAFAPLGELALKPGIWSACAELWHSGVKGLLTLAGMRQSRFRSRLQLASDCGVGRNLIDRYCSLNKSASCSA